MLLTIQEIESQLNNKFSPFQGEMDDLILRKRKKTVDNVGTLEKKLNIKLNKDFLSFISSYDLDNFSLGNIAFGSGSDYIEKLISINEGDDFGRWWQGNDRPDGIILIAISDPYSILLNTKNNEIYAIMSEEQKHDKAPISKDFESFVRGVGSLFLKKAQLQEVINSVGAVNQDFWHNI